MPERELADQLHGMAETAVAEQKIADEDLVRILRFIGSVVTVIDQAFDEVLAILIELSYLRPEHLQEPRKSELLADLDRVLERSRYREVEEICSRLHHLSERYEQVIEPKLGGLASAPAWSEVFYLLDEHEGAIIWMIGRRVSGLHHQLSTANDADLPKIKKEAADARTDVQDMLKRLWHLRNQILGLSGDAGWLELIETGRRTDAKAETISRTQ